MVRTKEPFGPWVLRRDICMNCGGLLIGQLIYENLVCAPCLKLQQFLARPEAR